MSHIKLIATDWYQHLEYETVPVNAGGDNKHYLAEYLESGHMVETLCLDRCHLDDTNQNIAPVVDFFHWLQHPSFCVHRLKPGRYIPTHSDQYAYYMKTHSIEDINSVFRFIVFLEDSQDGHMLIIKNQVFNSYKAGYYACWQGTTPHAALNYGTTDRYTLQVTGVKK